MVDKDDILSALELLLLGAILDLGEDSAYGLAIFARAQALAKDLKVSYGSIYPTLDRLERKGLLSSKRADPLPERGGQPRRYFRVEAEGERSYALNSRMLRRLPILDGGIVEQPA